MLDDTGRFVDAATRRLHMLLLPSVRWKPGWDAFSPGAYPDPTMTYKLLARDHAIDTTLIDPFDLPWNPFAGQHQVLGGLDPARALTILTRYRHADVVLACFEPSAVALLAARSLAGFRAPIVIGDIGLTQGWRLRERLLDFVVPRADAIYVLGSNQVDHIHKRWRTPADVRFIHQHIDTEFYQPSRTVSDGYILSVGDDSGRDFDTLLAAFTDLDATLLLRSPLIPPGAELPNVQVVRERMGAHAYRELFQRASFVVVPLHPMVTASGVSTVLEAMAMGKALVVSDSPGIRDYVTHEETALVVPCGNVSAMRAAVQRLMREPDTRARFGKAARAFVERNCTDAAHAAKHAAALRALVPR